MRQAWPMSRRISKTLTSSRLRTKVQLMQWKCSKTISNFMILRTRPRTRDRLRRLIFAGFARSWLLFCVLCATASATPPRATPTAPAPAQTPTPPAKPPPPPPDESFLEFLGSDDVGDAAWWEFLKKAPPRGSDPPPAT